MEHVKIEYKICEIYKTDDELIIRSDKSERWGSKTLMLITCFFVLTLLVPYFVFNALNILMFILSCVILLIELMITLISFRIVENKILVNKRKRLETSIYFIVVILVFYLLKTLFLPITPPLEYSLEYFSIGFLISFLIICYPILCELLFNNWYVEWNIDYKNGNMFLFKKKFQSKHIENKPLISNNITTNQKSNTSKELLSFNVSQIESIPLRIKKEGFKFIRIYYIVYFNINENDNSKSDILILKSLKKKKSEALKKYLEDYLYLLDLDI